MARWGMNVPLVGVPLGEQEDWFRELEDLGYTDLWSSEAQGFDGFTPLALASVWTKRVRLGCACFPVQTRGPALMAMSVAALCQAAPGRFAMGIGSSSKFVVEHWNGVPFEKPYQVTRDMLRFLREALRGQRIDRQYESFRVRGFRLEMPVDPQPPILVAALREGMLRLAGREGDGVLLNWVLPEDLPTVIPIVKAAGPDKEIAIRLTVCPLRDAEKVREHSRFGVVSYLAVPTYRSHQEWLGRGPVLQKMWDCWDAGDVKGALAACPDEIVDAFIVHGSAEECRDKIQRFIDGGVETPILAIQEQVVDPRQATRDLAPR